MDLADYYDFARPSDFGTDMTATRYEMRSVERLHSSTCVTFPPAPFAVLTRCWHPPRRNSRRSSGLAVLLFIRRQAPSNPEEEEVALLAKDAVISRQRRSDLDRNTAANSFHDDEHADSTCVFFIICASVYQLFVKVKVTY